MPQPGMGWGEEYQPMNPNPQWDVEPPGQMHVPQDGSYMPEPISGPGGGGSSPWGNLGNIFSGITSGVSGLLGANGGLIPGLATAYQQWKDAEKYKETAREAMKYGDPFGETNRKYYQDRLQRSYDNPEEFLNDPGHVAKRQSGINALTAQNAMKGYTGSGKMTGDLAKYIQDQDSQFLDEERRSMQPMTGAQFNPAAAGQFLMEGNNQAIRSQNAALGALMYPFGNMNGPGGGGGNRNGGSGQRLTQSDQDLLARASEQGLRSLKLPDGSTVDIGAWERSGRNDGTERYYPTGQGAPGQDYSYGPGQEYGPGEYPGAEGYDPGSGGMGGWEGGDWGGGGGGDFYPTGDWDWSGWDY